MDVAQRSLLSLPSTHHPSCCTSISYPPLLLISSFHQFSIFHCLPDFGLISLLCAFLLFHLCLHVVRTKVNIDKLSREMGALMSGVKVKYDILWTMTGPQLAILTTTRCVCPSSRFQGYQQHGWREIIKKNIYKLTRQLLPIGCYGCPDWMLCNRGVFTHSSKLKINTS